MFNWLSEELSLMIPVFIFFFCAFTLADFTEVMMKKEYMLHYNFILIACGSLVMAKGVVLADKTPFIQYFSKKPLIYSIVWKTIVYSCASLAIRLIEHVIHLWIHGEKMHSIITQTASRVELIPFWLGQMWLSVLLFIFISYRELIYVVGTEKVRKIFFG